MDTLFDTKDEFLALHVHMLANEHKKGPEEDWREVDLSLLVRWKRGFKTREQIPFSRGIGWMEVENRFNILKSQTL